MAAALFSRRALWLLPIALAVCALMVLPGAALMGTAASAGVSPAFVGASAGGTASAPAISPAATDTPSLVSELPSAIQQVPWVHALAQPGSTLKPLTSLPSLGLIGNPVPMTAGHVNPFYVAEPAPLGLADYGLGATTYSYETSHFLGEVTFNTAPNVTDPQSTGVIEPGGQADGYVGSVHEFGIQLNTVASQFRIPGTDQGFFWTQNVVNWNDTGIHFVDDTFNLTSATKTPFYLAPGTIVSGCGENASGVDTILAVYGGVFQCVGGTIPLSPAAYPVTIQLYNNATTNAANETELTYGYRIVESGLGVVYTGISDAITFANPTASIQRPHLTPGFSVDGFRGAPPGLFRDAEIVLVGNIGGDNSVFRAISGSVHLEYSNASAGGFRSVPSAYNFGGDTGETSSGIADYWTPNHTLEINQGPAMLYGLWNAIPGSAVPSGSIHLAGSVSPNYGLVFVSNTPSPLDPWATGARDNMSWLPTTDTGTFSTYLPPLGAPWTTGYHVRAFAAGYAERNGTVVTGSSTNYRLTLTPAPGTINAPLYMFSNAQASSLAAAVTGIATPPYDFSGLTVNMNASFNHLNDYGYPDFVAFMAQGVTQPIEVSSVYQGYDSPSGNYYFYDFAPLGASTGVTIPGPQLSGSMPYYTSGINIYEGANDQVTNELLAGDGYNIQVVLWADSNALVTNVESILLGPGVFVGDSTDTTVENVTVQTGGTGITNIGSIGTVGWNLDVNGSLSGYPSIGVEDLSSGDDTYTWLNATNGAFGISAGDFYGAGADFDPYYYLAGTVGTTVSHLFASNQSWGANFSLSEQTTLRWVTATLNSTGIFTEDSSSVSAAHVYSVYNSTGVSLIGGSGVTLDWIHARVYSLGVSIDGTTSVTINYITATDHSVAVVIV